MSRMLPRARPRPWRVSVFIAVSCCLLAASCAGRASTVTLAGSTAFQPFAEKLADAYDAAHPEINVTVQGGGSSVGISAAINGAAQIGMADLVSSLPTRKSSPPSSLPATASRSSSTPPTGSPT